MKYDKVGSVMTTDVIRAEYGTPFKEVAHLLADHRISGLPVVDEDDKVIGVICETDLMEHRPDVPVPYEPRHHFRFTGLTPRSRRQATKTRSRTAGQLMTEPPVTVHAEETIAEAARTMARRRVERLPVLDEEDRLVGMVTRRDLLQVFLRPDTEIRAEVIEDVLVRTLRLAPGAIDVFVAEGVVTLTGHLERGSDTEIAVFMTKQIDGVVAVVDHLTHRLDDDARPRPDERAPHDIADDRLRRR
ncbi:MAG: CBS domain-containing protein [Streptomyces sp.]|jgi:CBS domain-containing protein|nr:CBS domain-containing protein [Streptomyces sp.]